ACPEKLSFDSYLLSVGPGEAVNTIGLNTPKVHFDVVRPKGTPGREWADCVENFACTLQYQKNGAGQKILAVDASWPWPEDPACKGVNLGLFIDGRIDAPGKSLGLFLTDATAHVEIADLPKEAENWHIIARSVDAQNHLNTYVEGVTP